MTLAYLLAAGCYDPHLRDCTVQCASPSDCAGDQYCSAGWCVSDKQMNCETAELGTDAAMVTSDATVTPPADAADMCPQSCTKGTCVEGVCVIDCSATDACRSTDVICPANVPCRVVCGDNACEHKVNCLLSTRCEVQCTGSNACHDEILCPLGGCDVTCSGYDSCDKRIKCSSSCSCDVACTGISSCGEVSECPSFSCRFGNGCNSALTGCDSCSL